MFWPLLLACAAETDPLTVPLRWVRGGEETWETAERGLLWDLANLGVEPEAFADVDVGDDGATFTLSAATWPNPEAWEAALAPLRESEELAATGAIDVGRFLLATLFSPGRYYAITGACATREAWEAGRLRDVETYTVTESLLVEGTREVRFDVGAGAFISTEGLGEHEAIDPMPNGQQRFAVYDDDGLVPYATTSPAGQPGRCMWCHESTVQKGDPQNPGYDDFVARVTALDEEMAARRAAWPTPLEAIDHEAGEWLVLQFLEPSPARVAREWGVDEADVPALPTHDDGEYPDWGPLYTRADVDALVEWTPLALPADSREPDARATLQGAEELPPCE